MAAAILLLVIVVKVVVVGSQGPHPSTEGRGTHAGDHMWFGST